MAIGCVRSCSLKISAILMAITCTRVGPRGQWQDFLAAGGVGLLDTSARDLGQELFTRLLGGPENVEKWREVIDRAERDGRPVRLLIDAASDELRNLPFGLLCHPQQNYHLFRPRRGA